MAWAQMATDMVTVKLKIHLVVMMVTVTVTVMAVVLYHDNMLAATCAISDDDSFHLMHASDSHGRPT